MNLRLKVFVTHAMTGIGFALLAAVATLFIKDSFVSEVRVIPAEGKDLKGFSGISAAAAAFGVGGGSLDDPSYLCMEILDSRWLKEELLKTPFEYKVRPWRFGQLRTMHQTLFDQLHVKNLDRAVSKVDALMKTERDTRTKRVTITVETRSPELSQGVAHRATELLQEFLMNRTQTTGHLKAQFSKARLAEAEDGALAAEGCLREFATKNRGYAQSSDPGIRLLGARLEQELQLRRQLVSALAMNYEQALMDEKDDLPKVTILDAANLPEEKSRPHRSTIVFFVFLLGTAGSWAWSEREWILRQAMGKGESDAA